MRILIGVSLSFLLAPDSDALAESWTCRNAELVRHVLTFYPNAPESLPCKVFYSKPKEQVMPRVLWTAENAEHFCETQAAAFVQRLESWGWECTVDAPEPIVDSTDPRGDG